MTSNFTFNGSLRQHQALPSRARRASASSTTSYGSWTASEVTEAHRITAQYEEGSAKKELEKDSVPITSISALSDYNDDVSMKGSDGD